MNGLAVAEDRYYTVDEWLALEKELDIKFEYLDGRLFDVRAMAGGTISHGRVCANINRHLGNAINAKGKDCFTYTSEVKIDLRRYHRYYYPDASVRCGEEEAGDSAGSYANPTVIVEVVSESSYRRDTGEKFRHYRSLRALRDYVLVFLDEPAVIVYSRERHDQHMVMVAYYGLEEEVEIPSLGIFLPLRTLYEQVEFLKPTTVVPHPGKPHDAASEE